MWGELHEQKEIKIELRESLSAGKVNRLFRELGATLHYDVYSFDTPKSEAQIWQSESYLYIRLLKNNHEVDAQEDIDKIIVLYPFATRPSSDQALVLEIVQKVALAFDGKASYKNESFDPIKVQTDWDYCNDFLLKEWGEEPGSESLRIMIEENYT